MGENDTILLELTTWTSCCHSTNVIIALFSLIFRFSIVSQLFPQLNATFIKLCLNRLLTIFYIRVHCELYVNAWLQGLSFQSAPPSLDHFLAIMVRLIFRRLQSNRPLNTIVLRLVEQGKRRAFRVRCDSRAVAACVYTPNRLSVRAFQIEFCPHPFVYRWRPLAFVQHGQYALGVEEERRLRVCDNHCPLFFARSSPIPTSS